MTGIGSHDNTETLRAALRALRASERRKSPDHNSIKALRQRIDLWQTHSAATLGGFHDRYLAEGDNQKEQLREIMLDAPLVTKGERTFALIENDEHAVLQSNPGTDATRVTVSAEPPDGRIIIGEGLRTILGHPKRVAVNTRALCHAARTLVEHPERKEDCALREWLERWTLTRVFTAKEWKDRITEESLDAGILVRADDGEGIERAATTRRHDGNINADIMYDRNAVATHRLSYFARIESKSDCLRRTAMETLCAQYLGERANTENKAENGTAGASEQTLRIACAALEGHAQRAQLADLAYAAIGAGIPVTDIEGETMRANAPELFALIECLERAKEHQCTWWYEPGALPDSHLLLEGQNRIGFWAQQEGDASEAKRCVICPPDQLNGHKATMRATRARQARNTARYVAHERRHIELLARAALGHQNLKRHEAGWALIESAVDTVDHSVAIRCAQDIEGAGKKRSLAPDVIIIDEAQEANGEAER